MDSISVRAASGTFSRRATCAGRMRSSTSRFSRPNSPRATPRGIWASSTGRRRRSITVSSCSCCSPSRRCARSLTGRGRFPRGAWKLVVFILGVIAALAALVFRLTQVQLVEGARFAAAARANQIRRIPVAAPRGRIYDRHGVVLVRSRPSFVCAMIPSDVHDIGERRCARSQAFSAIAGKPVLWKRLLHHRGIRIIRTSKRSRLYEPYGPVDPRKRPHEFADGAPRRVARRAAGFGSGSTTGARLSVP